MGYLLADSGLEPDPDKIEDIRVMPKPQSVEGAQCLNGFVRPKLHFLDISTQSVSLKYSVTQAKKDWAPHYYSSYTLLYQPIVDPD